MSKLVARLRLAALVATLALSGCQLTPTPPPPVAPPPTPAPPPEEPPPPFALQQAGDNDRLIAYYGYLLGLSPEQLAQEYERTLRFYRQQSADFTFMQLVLLRVVPDSPTRDYAQAQDMLSSFLKEPRSRSSELRPLALVLHTLLTEQQQKDAEIQAQAQKLKEETRRYEEVKQKLDALIDAERKMLERNKPVRKP
jgi:hypothetical protein